MINKDEAGIGLMGYDPVSYFQHHPQKGLASISSTFRGVPYRFVNGINKYQFELSPEKFLPQYGGFCATAMSEGKVFPVDPEEYLIHEGKLYLFFSEDGNDMKTLWNQEPGARREAADKNWKSQNYLSVDQTIANKKSPN